MTLILSGDIRLAQGYTRPDDADAVAYITAVEAADGQSLETEVRMAINAFVKGCKADGIWNAIKASCILAGARTLEGALVPLAGTAPTNFNFVAGDYNRKTGLIGNGSNKYIDTNVKPSDGIQDNAHISTYVTTTASSPLKHYIGAILLTPSLDASQIIDNNGPINFTLNSGGGLSGPANTGNTLTGFFGASRPSSTSLEGRYDKTTITAANSSLPPNSLSYFIFGRNLNGLPDGLSNRSHAFYSIGEALDLALLDARVTDLINKFAEVIP